MRLISRVCAEFHDPEGRTLFRIDPARRLVLVDAPEAIRQDPLFAMLLADGSLEEVTTPAQQQRLETDPTRWHDATGKAVRTDATGSPAAPETTAGAGEAPAKSTRKTTVKPAEAKPTAEQNPTETKPTDPGTTAAPAKAD